MVTLWERTSYVLFVFHRTVILAISHFGFEGRFWMYQFLVNSYVLLFYMGDPRGRVGKVAVFQRSKSFDHLTAVSGVGSSPALAYKTSQVLLAGVSGGFPGVFPFRPTYRLARLYE